MTLDLVLQFEQEFSKYIKTKMVEDLAHDLAHVQRVVALAKTLCRIEHAMSEVVVPAAWLHDCFSYPKDHEKRHLSSVIAADRACEFLESIEYPQEYIEAIRHAISAHSYSAEIVPTTLEAKIVQDADRLDALGAVGIARCLQVSSLLNRPLYSSEDPFCVYRVPEDSQFTIDHFYRKLLTLSDTMNTESAKREAHKRTEFMQQYLDQLEAEVG